MDGGGTEIPEPNPNLFGTSLAFNSSSPFGFEAENEDCLGIWVWGGKNRLRPTPLPCLQNTHDTTHDKQIINYDITL